MRRRYLCSGEERIDLSKPYFAIEVLEDGLQVKFLNNYEYCIDNGIWKKANSLTKIQANAGQILYFKGNLKPKEYEGIGTFDISKKCNVSGNIMSLLFGDNFEGLIDLSGYNYVFYQLFYYSNIIDASQLILPATTLSEGCYQNMFYYCSKLSKVPALPATTLAEKCYANMFGGCTSLVTAPDLPATTLAKKCYRFMFNGCISLVNVPTLPATTLANYCYYEMFYGCTSLVSGPALPATKLTMGCYQSMFRGCTSLVNAPFLSATTLAQSCCYYMFEDCTSLVTAPALSATTLAENCYDSMFKNCISLSASPELPATTLASGCYMNMFEGTNALPDCTNIDFTSESVVASGGLRGLFAETKVTDEDLYNILPINPATGKYWLPVTTLADACYSRMFSGCTSLITAPELPATTLADSCYWYMFSGCTSLVTAPVLSATTVVVWCYYNMFSGCSKLNYIKMLATSIYIDTSLRYWVSGVSSTGTFVKHPNMTSLPTGSSGIPDGWTVEDYNESNLITFYIDNIEYQAEEGMTWEEWINSKYNTDGYILHLSQIFGDIYDPTEIMNVVRRDVGVEASDLIESDYRYSLYLN